MKVTKFVLLIGLLCAALSTGYLAEQTQKNKAEVALQAAIKTETVDGNLKSAIEQYKKIAELPDANRTTVATALLRMGQCHEKLGETHMQEARKAYEQVLREYGDQTEAVKLAREKLSSLVRVQPATEVAAGKFVMRKAWEGSASSVSPDGRYATYVEEYNLAVRDLSTGKIRRLTDKGSIETRAFVDHSIFSPDGNEVAYEWFNGDETWDLRLIGFDGSEPRVLLHRDNGDDIYPCAWSPDGEKILAAFMRMGGPGFLTAEIAFISVADGTIKIIKQTHKTQFPAISGMNLSPDGRFIAYSASNKEGQKQNDLFLLSSDGNSDFLLVEHPANDHSPTWTPDGKSVLFVSDRGGAPGLWMIDVDEGKSDGEPELVKPDISGIEKVIGFTLQGAYYFTLSVSMGDVYVADYNPTTGKVQGKPRVLATRRGKKIEPAWSPDGQQLAFYRRTGPDSWAPGWRTLFIRSSQTGEEREFPNDLILYGSIQWFPDGRSLLVSSKREGDSAIDFYRIEVETGATNLLMQRKDGAGSFWPGLSPDGKTIYFTYYKNESGESYTGPGDCFLGSYQIETGLEKELCSILPRDQRERQSITVSPDGRRLAFVVHEGPWPITSVIKVILLEGGQSQEIFRSPWPAYIPGNQGLEWTQDGSHLLFVRVPDFTKDLGDLMRLPAEGGEAQEVGLTALRLKSPSIHPDGRQLAFKAGRKVSNEIWVMENFLPETRDKK